MALTPSLPPGTPQSVTESVKQTNGDTTVSKRFWVEADNGKVAYMLLYNDDPRPQGSPQRRLEAARDGALKAGPATLITSRAISMDGIPGLAYTGRIDKDGSMADVVDYYNGQRLYQLLVIATAGVTAKYRDAYFNSFRILPQR